MMKDIQYLLFDWGDTLMLDDPQYTGAMCDWPEVAAMPGVAALLPRLAEKYRCAVLSNAVESDAALMMEAFARVGLAECFHTFLTSKELGARKPDAAFFMQALQRLGTQAGQAIMIGNDYVKDIAPAKAVGLGTILITAEDGDYPLADVVVKDFNGLLLLLQASINQKAWEYRADEYWNRTPPADKAAALCRDPLGRFHFHRAYFDNGQVSGKRIANVCGSNGRMAVPLALLGAEATVFDISEEGKRYALALAEAAGVSIGYVLGDFAETDLSVHGNMYDIVFAEGGILHYFADLPAFTSVLHAITKPGGRLILSDFHPFRKINPTGSSMMRVAQAEGDYFDARLHSVPVAYEGFFPEEERADFPQCLCRHHTIGEIVNAVIAARFTLEAFQEHPSFEDGKLPGFFTILARKG